MSATLPRRRYAEISAKLLSLNAELKHWKNLTEEENRGLRRHHSQVRRLAAAFDGLTESVKTAIEALLPGSTDAVFDNAESWENQILAAHSIWEVFRSKLVLREDELFRNVLAACDDLAWECYGPATTRFAPDRKGPPLVYFTATWSPFARSRDSSFQNEVRAGAGIAGMLTDDAFLAVLRRLPIPLVSVPWYQAFHLPGALIIAHEVGHIVEFDFDLTSEIATALDGAGLDHLDVWKGWASEVFADLYGCLCMGPAFVGAMMDLLSTSVKSVQTEVRKGGKYPTRALRVELMLEALIQTKHKNDAARLLSTWEGAYGPMQTMLNFKSDVEKVVKAVYDGPYKGTALTTITTFPTSVTGDLQTIGEAAAGGFIAQLAEYNDPRLLFAGAQWLHENPQPGQNADAYKFIVEQIMKKGANQFRMRGKPVENKVTLDADLVMLEEADRQSGRDLQEFLHKGGAW
jgi:hypothetical protein